jgi:hypothetical protein
MESFRRNKTKAPETTEFLGLQTDSEFKWKIHTEYVIHKLSSLCVTIRPVTLLMRGGGCTFYIFLIDIQSCHVYAVIFWGD